MHQACRAANDQTLLVHVDFARQRWRLSDNASGLPRTYSRLRIYPADITIRTTVDDIQLAVARVPKQQKWHLGNIELHYGFAHRHFLYVALALSYYNRIISRRINFVLAEVDCVVGGGDLNSGRVVIAAVVVMAF